MSDMIDWLAIWIEDGGMINTYGTDEDREMYERIKERLQFLDSEEVPNVSTEGEVDEVVEK